MSRIDAIEADLMTPLEQRMWFQIDNKVVLRMIDNLFGRVKCSICSNSCAQCKECHRGGK